MDHGTPGKGLLFETGVRIAQFIHYPAMFGTDGIKFDGMVSTIDIGPSMLHLAGIDISSDVSEKNSFPTKVLNLVSNICLCSCLF